MVTNLIHIEYSASVFLLKYVLLKDFNRLLYLCDALYFNLFISRFFLALHCLLKFRNM